MNEEVDKMEINDDIIILKDSTLLKMKKMLDIDIIDNDMFNEMSESWTDGEINSYYDTFSG